MLYTPKEHICLGEVLQEKGKMYVRIKKPDHGIYETMSLDALIDLLTSLKAS